MRHIIGILLQNESGALSRVAGLFSSRGYNIESLSVAATDDPTVSRITLVTKGSEAVIQQIVNQLNKLIDVRGRRRHDQRRPPGAGAGAGQAATVARAARVPLPVWSPRPAAAC